MTKNEVCSKKKHQATPAAKIVGNMGVTEEKQSSSLHVFILSGSNSLGFFEGPVKSARIGVTDS